MWRGELFNWIQKHYCHSPISRTNISKKNYKPIWKCIHLQNRKTKKIKNIQGTFDGKTSSTFALAKYFLFCFCIVKFTLFSSGSHCYLRCHWFYNQFSYCYLFCAFGAVHFSGISFYRSCWSNQRRGPRI